MKEISNNKFKNIFNDNNNLKIKNNYFKNNLLNSFSNLKNFPENFKDIISNCQNFLTLILFNIGSVSYDEEYKLNKQMENLLQNFVKIFKIFFNFNDKLNIISYKCFYNDGMSKYLNFKRECKIYISNKKMKFKNKKFCLIDYLWLFDPAAKNEILQHFNSFKQNEEIISNLFDSSFFERKMFFEIKIHRENIIEDTMNTVSREEKNLRKPLKVKFIGEQGVDEGGVRKEFFMLLVRKLFDPNY
jgi:ubiquitin-protein ligase E3 A